MGYRSAGALAIKEHFREIEYLRSTDWQRFTGLCHKIIKKNPNMRNLCAQMMRLKGKIRPSDPQGPQH